MKRKIFVAAFLLLPLIVAAIALSALASEPAAIDVKYTSVSYGEGVTLRLSATATNLPAGATAGAEIREGSPDAEPTEAVVEQHNKVSAGDQFIFLYDGLKLDEMTENVYVTPYIKLSSGEIIRGEMKKTSVLEYVYRALGKIGTSAISNSDMKAAFTAMLSFGAAAQEYSGKNTDRPANGEYYLVRTVDGVISTDGFTKGLYMKGDTVPLLANRRDDKVVIGWSDSAGAAVSEYANFMLIVGDKNEIYTVRYGGLQRSIAYELGGGTIDGEYATSYVEGEGADLPEPTKDGYLFGGWFSTPTFESDSLLHRITDGCRGDITLYAKWCGIISSLDGDDIFATGKQTLNAASDTGEHKNSFVAEGDVLLWNQGESIRSQMSLSGNVAAKLDGETAITVRATLARDAETSVTPASFRLRRADASFVSILNPFTVDTSGNVLLGGQEGSCIATLTEEFQTIEVVVDFEAGTMTYYSGGLAAAVYYFDLPGTDKEELTKLEWLSKITGTLWQLYSEKVAGGGKIFIKNVTLIAGNCVQRAIYDNLTDDEKEEMLGEIKTLVEDQRETIYRKYLFGSSTEDIMSLTTSNWGTPSAYPSDEHPRLLLTAETLPAIRESIEKMDNATKLRFRNLLGSLPAHACRLPEPTLKGVNSTVDLENIHNFNAGYLELIQTKALGYLLYGNELYGYQAIYYLKNFIETLDIVQIASDQCRQYGSVMFTAAIVYDWCYDLLTEEDKEQIIAGVENRICRMTNQIGAAMEVGFPPTKQTSVAGHGAERQILRDYLAFSTAIYGDNDSWWEYVAARVYHDFVPFRNYYFTAGVPHQGTGYAPGRHISDLFSDWIITTATGVSPYTDDIKRVVSGLTGYEITTGIMFNDGDKTGDHQALSSMMHAAFISAYLYEDARLLAEAEEMLGNGVMSSDHNYLTSVLYLILPGLSDITAVEDRYEDKELIQYNGHPLGQYVVREAWASESSAAVMMRLKEHTTGNHEHSDSGTFEIYYKGMLTSDGGCYNNYGHVHTQYYHQATISHNGLIIFNPSLAETDKGYYSGGQVKRTTPTLANFETPTFAVATVTGRQHGYTDAEERDPLYAYIAGDITGAYDPTSVEYVGRRMLTVYTKNSDFPMVFFVYDDVESDKASYEKKFLLQISSDKEPTVSGNTVMTEHDGGRLVLTSLSDSVRIDKVGGVGYSSNGKYSAALSQNYLVNGVQLCPKSDTANDGHWGRIEIVFTGATKKATFMNVIYVTDAGQTKTAPKINEIVGTGVDGGTFGDVAAIFITSRDRSDSTVSATVSGEGTMKYYVSGVSAGEWSVRVNGADYGTVSATEEGGLLCFEAPAGSLTLTKK